PRRCLLERRGVCALRVVGVAAAGDSFPARLSRAHRDSGDSAGATFGGAAGGRPESASVGIDEEARYRRGNDSAQRAGAFRAGAGGRVPRAQPVQQMELSRWNRVADENGFIVVYPSGKAGLGPRVWRERDARFISDLIDKLQAEYNIDPRRIYANGLSNGGGMSFVLSCTLADRIAAVGMVGAAHLLPWSWCKERRPMPMITFHGTADSFAPYKGGMSWVAASPFANIPRWTANWARRNR